jgi:hypothetical protein
VLSIWLMNCEDWWILVQRIATVLYGGTFNASSN